VSRLDRAVGLARSLAMYRAIPLRGRRLRRLYAQFVERGDLVFDIGGHVGNRARAFVSLGCRVVVVEPQPDFARLLRRAFARQPEVHVIEAAVSDAPGRAELAISERTPTVSTLVTSWREAREKDEGFSGVRWNRLLKVETTTLDLLIERFGKPVFAKIDVEGAEPQVSFEYLPGDLDRTRMCVERLATLGSYRFNRSVGETNQLSSDEWIAGHELISALDTPEVESRSGDVYARLA
jgi:FkbM family methyltransferase